jgi:uncharacterized protein (TIGR00266 family)
MAGYGQIEADGRPLLQMSGQEKDGFQLGADPSTILPSSVVNRPAFAHARCDLQQGQEVIAAAGAMLWMDGNMPMGTSCYGGLLASLYRHCSGQTFCMNKFSGPGEVSFGFDLPGDMLPFAITPGQGWIISAGTFICGTTNAIVSARWAGLATCLCGGEGMFLTKVYSNNGNGLFYAGGFGQLQRHEVPEGKTLYVNNGLFFAANDKTQIELGLPGSCSSWLWGKEGFVMKLHGPAVVYTQNRDPQVFMRLLNPLPPLPEFDANAAQGAAGGIPGV